LHGRVLSHHSARHSPCAEVAKFNVELREGKLIEGDFGKPCYSLATARAKTRKRWRKGATPTGSFQ
jgi:hypothetical protein